MKRSTNTRVQEVKLFGAEKNEFEKQVQTKETVFIGVLFCQQFKVWVKMKKFAIEFYLKR